MFNPSVLKAEIQWPHVSTGDQLSGFHGKVGVDLLHHRTVLHRLDAPRRTESEVVGSERCSRQPHSQPTGLGQFQKAVTPGRLVQGIRIHAEVVGLISDRKTAGSAPEIQLGLDTIQVTSCALVCEQQSIDITTGWLRGPWFKTQAKALAGHQPLAFDGGAMAEHQEAVESPLPLHDLETKQCPQGLTCSGASEHQQITAG